MAAAGVPRWVSLEAGTGWGKTRLVQEFYGVLAARGTAPAYWPPTLWSAVAQGDQGSLANVERRRNLLHPEVVRPDPGAVPNWFWWGITCGSRSGTASQALLQDLGQFEGHRAGLEARWREIVGLRTRAAKSVRSHSSELIGTGVGEAASVAASMMNMALPGLGFLLLAAKSGGQALKRHLDEGPFEIDVSAGGTMATVEEIAPAVTQLASAGIPMVVAIEDVHLGDPVLVELLVSLLTAASAPILVVTTSWPGLLDQPERVAARLGTLVPAERSVRLREDHELVGLGDADLGRLVEHHLPGIDERSRDRIARRFPNPLMVDIVCSLAALQRPVAAGQPIRDELIDGMPRNIRQLYEKSWEELPVQVRDLLATAAVLLPCNITDDQALFDDHWDSRLLEAVLTEDASEDAGIYAWERRVTESLRRFHEPAQRDVATDAAAHELPADTSDIYAAAHRWLVGYVDTDDPVASNAARRLMVALALEHHIPWTNDVSAALVVICNQLGDTGATADLAKIIELTDAALDGGIDHGERTTIRLRQAKGWALGCLGRIDDALVALEDVIVDLTRVRGFDAADTLIARGTHAELLAESGRVDEAVGAMEKLLPEVLQTFGIHARATSVTRTNLAGWVGELGRVDEAVVLLEELLTDQVQARGVDAEDALTTRGHLVIWVRESGRVDEAIAMSEALLIDMVRVHGPVHPVTLQARISLGSSLVLAGRVDEAIGLLEDVLVELVELQGVDALLTLLARNVLAGAYAKSGRVDEAIAAFEELLADQTRVLGSNAPATMSTRGGLAVTIGELGRVDEAIAAFEELLADQTRMLGEYAPDTLRTRHNLAAALGESGRVDEAISALDGLVVDLTRVLGADSRQTTDARDRLVGLLFRAGRPEDALLVSVFGHIPSR